MMVQTNRTHTSARCISTSASSTKDSGAGIGLKQNRPRHTAAAVLRGLLCISTS